jgi:hypothetical protein
MLTPLSCVGTQPTVLSEPLVASCAFFFGL